MAGGEGTRLRPLTSNTPKPHDAAGQPADDGAHHQPAEEARLRRHRGHRGLPGQRHPHLLRRRVGVRRAHRLRHRGNAARHRRVRCATPWTSSTSRSSSSPATSLTDIDLAAIVDFHREQGGAGHHRAQGDGEPARVRHRHHPRGRLDRALPREADLGPGLQRHHQHRHLRARAGDLRLHRRRQGRSTSPATSSRPCWRTGKPLFGYVAEGYWEDVGTLEAYVQAHQDVLDEPGRPRHPRLPAGRRRLAGRGLRGRPGGQGARDRSSSATTAASRPAPTCAEYTRARVQRAGGRGRLHPPGRRPRQRLPRPRRPPAGLRGRPLERPAPGRPLRGGRRRSATSASSASTPSSTPASRSTRSRPSSRAPSSTRRSSGSRGAPATCSAASAWPAWPTSTSPPSWRSAWPWPTPPP